MHLLKATELYMVYFENYTQIKLLQRDGGGSEGEREEDVSLRENHLNPYFLTQDLSQLLNKM